jgi:hypothetical protein
VIGSPGKAVALAGSRGILLRLELIGVGAPSRTSDDCEE